MISVKFLMIVSLTILLFSRGYCRLTKFLRFYIITSVFYSVISILTFILLICDINIINEFIITSDDDSKIISWPFFLSVINITPTDQRFIFGLPLPMLYSWFLEPQFYSFYALFSLICSGFIQLPYKKFVNIIIFTGLLLTSSLTTYTILLLFALIRLYKKTSYTLRPLLYLTTIISVLISSYTLSIDNKSLISKFSPESSSTSFSYNVLTSALFGTHYIAAPLQDVRREVALKSSFVTHGSLLTSCIIITFLFSLIYKIIKSIISDMSLYIPLILLLFLLKDVIMYLYMPLYIFIFLIFILLDKRTIYKLKNCYKSSN